jgi:hypothetical protein
MPSRFEKAPLTALFLTIMAAIAVPAHADVILYSTGFEAPTFTVGALAGQDGWNQFGPSTATVENFFTLTGSQSVFLDGGTATQAGPWHQDPSAGTPYVDLSADIAIFTSTNQSEWQFAATGNNLTSFLGGIDITQTDQIEAITLGFPVIGTFARSTSFTSPTWNHVDLLFDIATQTYDISINGVQLASNLPFCETNAPGCIGGSGTTNYGDGVFDSFGQSTSGVSGLTNDSAYMDNYQVSDVSSVPEPSGLLLLVTVIGAFGVGLRRKFSI